MRNQAILSTPKGRFKKKHNIYFDLFLGGITGQYSIPWEPTTFIF